MSAHQPSVSDGLQRLAHLRRRLTIEGSADGLARYQQAITHLLRSGERSRPPFSGAWVSLALPTEGTPLVRYELDRAVVVLGTPAAAPGLWYHLAPWEYRLPPPLASLVLQTRTRLLEREEGDQPLGSLAQARAYLRRRAERVISGALQEDPTLVACAPNHEELATLRERLTATVVQYTAGLGVLEHLLGDPHLQDLYIDAPAYRRPIYVALGGFDDVRLGGRALTNVLLGERELVAVLARLQHESGQPFSEARPHLECDLPIFHSRATVVGPPLSHHGVALAIRRHATEPWTLPMLIACGALSAEAGGLLWLLLDGQATLLVAGPRGAGKTALLAALVAQLPRHQRILTIEDTPELPVRALADEGYQVQALSVRSTLGGAGTSAVDALRLCLRLGDSALVLGEVRGEEAAVLYEAMRTGAAASSVLGTIHGSSAVEVYRRVVHDLHVAPESYAVTDALVVCGIRRPGGGAEQRRRVVALSEVDRSDPSRSEELLTYDPTLDALVRGRPWEGSPLLARLAQRWAWSVEHLAAEAQLRGRLLHTQVSLARAQGSTRPLGLHAVAGAVDQFGLLSTQRAEGTITDAQVEQRWGLWAQERLGSAR